MQPQRQSTPYPGEYTVADYMRWPDDIRCELIDGVLYDMSPAPLIVHQRLIRQLAASLGTLITNNRGKGGCGDCELFLAPIDVVLSPNSVVQPDLIVVCDPAKLANGKYVDGAPDLVAEVLPPSTAVKDKREKRRLYEKSGVPEYLIVDPVGRYVEYYRLDGGSYGLPILWTGEDVPRLALFPDLKENLREIFDSVF
ncbi:MAG: Uma2 family endonuclease [Methylococcaceae bacterium]|nr:MAG: Uma2 family endonuclease [Methylococcaceae bacterium]